MVAAADELKAKLAAAGGDDVQVSLTGASGMWSDFNTANRTAMMKSELISWPVTMAILLLAFGSLVAAGLPLMLTIRAWSPRPARSISARSCWTSRSGR
jgi:RND superfamily putative drug exporter